MKQCSTCQDEFADKFSFCPVDGTPLSNLVDGSMPPTQSEPPVSTETFETASSFGTSDANRASGRAADDRAAFSTGDNLSGINAPATPIGSTGGPEEYHLTIMEDAGLSRRLMTEVRAAARQAQLTWPELRRDPMGFSKRAARASGQAAWRFFSSPNVAVASVSALVLVMTMVMAVVALERWRVVGGQRAADAVRQDLELTEMVTEIPMEQEELEKGTAGMNKGTGGGSKPKPERAAGGGGGGREQAKPASFGKLPQASLTVPQVVAPDPNPPKVRNPSLPVAATIDADPLLFPPDARVLPYGDPKSKSTELSSGPGTGGGVGSGEGGGVGPGRGGNTGGGDRNEGGGGPGGGGGGGVDYNKVFSGRDVTQKARILSKPEPQYTEEARKNQVQGTVILKAVFSSSGQVTNIRTVSGLPSGLTEKAIAAARQIRFTPAQKDGRAVSMYFQLEYNFNLY